MRFDLDNFPSQGRHLIEASAGTGKTHNLMQLAVKMFADEGIQPEHFVLMTFTRASTRELRARLRDALSGALQSTTQELTRQRLYAALRRLDQVTILTIHGFALHVLRELGPSVGIHARPMNENTEGLLLDAALDVYRELLNETTCPTLFRSTLGSAKEFATLAKVITNRATTWHPDGFDKPDLSQTTEQHRQRALALAPEIEQLKQTKGARSQTIESHCQAATDAAFPGAISSTTVNYFKRKAKDDPLFQPWLDLIQPTPCQSAFVAFALRQVERQFQTSLAAQGEMHPDQIIGLAATVAIRLDPSLRPNHRVILVDEFQDTDRDQWALLDHLYPDEIGRLMVFVGDPKQAIYRFRGADTKFYYQIRDALPTTHQWSLDTNYRSTETVVNGLNQLYDNCLPVGDTLECMPIHTGKKDLQPLSLDGQTLKGFNWCPALDPEGVSHLTAQLISLGATNRLCVGNTPLRGGHIGVLVDSWQVAAKIQQAGRIQGVSFHYADQRSVFSDPLSREMVHLLEAIANPDEIGIVSSAAATQLVGLSLLGEGTVQQHPDFIALQDQLLDARARWYREGPAAALGILFSHYQSRQRLPHDTDGLSGWMALAQCLEIFGASGKGLTPFEAARWWAHQATDQTKSPDNEKPRAPNRDGVVTITTVHSAKGLQYPVVILAGSLSFKSADSSDRVFSYCSDQGLVLDFRPESQPKANEDLIQDGHRLAYVALTRAEHAVFVAEPADRSAVSALLAGRSIDALGPDHQRFNLPAATSRLEPPKVPVAPLTPLNRSHAPSWFVRSYSSLVRQQHDDEHPTRASDESDLPLPMETEAAAWHGIPGGTATGNFVHAILEQSARQPKSPITTAYLKTHWPNHLEISYLEDMLAWIQAIRQVVLPGGMQLATCPAAMLRAEPQFQLPFADTLTLDQFLDHFQALSWWNDPIVGSSMPLTGQLNGFIDLVYEANGRYYVLDYKTNRLGDRGVHYTTNAIDHAMTTSHYQTQAAIYALALHRWLQQRLPNYDPEQHLGDVVYLFARGIDGPVEGVWSRPMEAHAMLSIAEGCLDATSH